MSSVGAVEDDASITSKFDTFVGSSIDSNLLSTSFDTAVDKPSLCVFAEGSGF